MFCPIYISSKKNLLNVLEKYKNLEGFKDTIEDFYISEYEIDSIYNLHLSELIDYQVAKKDASESLYLLYFIEEFEDGHSDTKLLRVFSSQQKAENSVALIKCIPEMASIYDQFEIYKNKIDQLGWREGFVTLK